MKKFGLIAVSILTFSLQVQAQQQFISSGRIIFEKRTAQLSFFESLVKEEDNVFLTEMKKTYPKIVSDFFRLEFTEKESLFKLDREIEGNKYIMMESKPNDKNYVKQNFVDQSTIMRQQFFENTYVIKDSLKKYNWKLTGEIREIAGFVCKKAITKIGDSVVVVAFYTDEILPRGGPYNFNGLPGMILGIAIPRLHMTLFATQIEMVNQVPAIPSVTESRAKYVTFDKVKADIDKAVNDWGRYANAIRWESLL
ncbi:MAG: hypothetical protein RL642_285 [Bacteroidota bacterium]